MAVTGVVLTGWAVLHMIGNLLVFAGPDTINRYGALLHGSPILWVQRIVLGAALVGHVLSAIALTRWSRRARPTGYDAREDEATTFASRTMRYGGALLFLFVVYHVLHIYGVGHADYRPGDVYHNVVAGFRVPPVVLIYCAASLVLGLHLWHGAWSFFQSLGLARAGARRRLRLFATSVAGLLTAGFLLPAVAVVLGLLD